MPKTEAFVELSNQMADAAERAGRFVLQVRTGWRPATGTVCLADHVLVADHALRHDEGVSVRTPDGRTLAAQVAGRDPASSLALLKVPDLGIAPAERMVTPARVGQIALAVGRGFSGAVVAGLGVVSSVGGPWRTGRGPAIEEVIRTDATPYPGFAGGALVAADGSCIGIATGIMLRGLGLVIPASFAWPIAELLAQQGRIRRAFFGISAQPVRLPESQRAGTPGRGILVVGVSENSPAAAAGMLIGDVLVAFNGHAVDDPEILLSLLTGDLVGRGVPVEILRGGANQTITVTLAERGDQSAG